VNHLFTWGALAGLLNRAGFPKPYVSLPNGPSLYREGEPSTLEHHLPPADIALFSWESRALEAPPICNAKPLRSEPIAERVASPIRADLSRPWRIQEIASKLATSVRNLQRALRSEGKSFSQVLSETRLEFALEAMKAKNRDLTEIAFCAGFADLAHFSRSARRHFLLAPSELRELL